MARKKAEIASVEDEALVKKEESEATELLATVSGWEIESQEDMDMCGAIKKQARDKREELEKRLKEITAPIRQAEKSARDLFRPRISTLQQVENVATEAIRQFELKKLALAREARKQVEAGGGVADEKTLLVAHGHGAVSAAAEVTTSRIFRFEVKNNEEIPERYWRLVLDEDLIQADINAAGGKISIPGIEVIEDIQVRNKARR